MTNLLGWKIPLIILGVSITWKLLRSPYWIHQEQEKKLQACEETIQELQTVSLKIVYDSMQPAYLVSLAGNDQKYFRIGIHNENFKAVDNVKVRLLAISPELEGLSRLLPFPVRPNSGESVLLVNPSDTEFVNVAKSSFSKTWISSRGSGTVTPCFKLCPAPKNHTGGIRVPIRDGESYVLTIQVTGKDVLGETKTFELGAKDGHHFIKLIKERKCCMSRGKYLSLEEARQKDSHGKIAFGNFAWRIPQQA